MGFHGKRLTALLASMMLAAMLGLSACDGNGGASSDSSAADSSASASSEAAESAADGEEAEGLYGSPWITTTVAGNLPDERPSAKDDFYTYANYDFLVAHQQD